MSARDSMGEASEKYSWRNQLGTTVWTGGCSDLSKAKECAELNHRQLGIHTVTSVTGPRGKWFLVPKANGGLKWDTKP